MRGLAWEILDDYFREDGRKVTNAKLIREEGPDLGNSY
jgi:hypothetical protein